MMLHKWCLRHPLPGVAYETLDFYYYTEYERLEKEILENSVFARIATE